ncbi:HTH-type transcriptional activator RhaR [bioreactor metagenome]|uniref:HTH-type transcriptional activator RhaR n=1 Tax=bioreactor metagenome TaxID=1076179 RepID=A0A645IQV8_9ZZZZ
MLQCARMFQVEQLIAVVSEKIQEFARETSKYDTSKRATIRKVLRYMDQNYSKGLTLPKVAKVAHMAPSYFSMYFKKEIGENYNQFVNRMKIERAKELLQNPSVKIHEVGTLVGFEDSKYFSRKFRTVTGMTPREYRESISVCKE